MNDENYKLTTVKVLTENYTKFKVSALSTNITLQKLVNRAIDKYLTDEKFRKLVDEVELIRDNNKF